MNMRLFQHTSRILRVVVAVSSPAMTTGVLATGAFAQTDSVQQQQEQQRSACILVGNCNQPGQNNNGGGPAYVHKFAAVAVSDTTLATGWSWKANSRAEAERVALASCATRARDCHIQLWGEDECLALATSEPDGSWGADYDRNGARARAKAVAQCRSVGGKNCVVKADPCAHDN